jgi:osomolarity two-component system phosphorelay intermediate protein YPD1
VPFSTSSRPGGGDNHFTHTDGRAPHSSSEGDLPQLSSLGHFLKGSSATLGLTKVKDSCEKIQHYGQKKDEAGTTDVPDEDVCLARIKDTLVAVKEEYAEVEKVLRKFYSP